MKTKLTWYGRCCFLFEIEGVRVLIDPHDTFDGVDIGTIKTDYVLISSVAHDHGHIGAAPNSRWNYGSAGRFETKEGVIITGIDTHEERGTPNIIFNIRYKDVSITNFADWGKISDIDNFTSNEIETLGTTNVALARPNLIDNGPSQMAELVFEVCNPNILIPHHNYPESFVRDNPSRKMLKSFNHYNPLVDRLIEKLDYKVDKIDDYSTTIDPEKIKDKSILLLSKIHPQVKLAKDSL